MLQSNVYEKNIELFFNNVISELRTEWLFLQNLESLESRNLRLLQELEDVYKSLSKN